MQQPQRATGMAVIYSFVNMYTFMYFTPNLLLDVVLCRTRVLISILSSSNLFFILTVSPLKNFWVSNLWEVFYLILFGFCQRPCEKKKERRDLITDLHWSAHTEAYRYIHKLPTWTDLCPREYEIPFSEKQHVIISQFMYLIAWQPINTFLINNDVSHHRDMPPIKGVKKIF